MSEYSNKSLESNKLPVISVVMPAFNAERFLNEAIQSILNQTFSDFEFIIVNDGSTDRTEHIIKSYQDPRIVYIQNDTNLGLSRSFNKAINAAKGAYIARMDADDISLPHRFEQELDFLKEHPEIGILGSAITRISEQGKDVGSSYKPSHHLILKWQSLFSTPLFHPTVMARTEILKAYPFDESLHNSEDYELWSRLLFTTRIQFANLEEPLLKYRIFQESFTQGLNAEKREVSAQNTIRNMRQYTTLTHLEEQIIIRIRKETKVRISEMFKIYQVYKRAVRSFIEKELPDKQVRKSIKKSLCTYAWSLLIFRLKQVLR